MYKTKLIYTKRFLLKPLKPKHASKRYLAWLKDGVTIRYISAAKKTRRIRDLKIYIRKFSNRKDCMFLRILTKKAGHHIGNIKYHPIDFTRKTAVMGMLVGEPTWRGKGVAKEVIEATAKYLQSVIRIRKIYLGVQKNNLPAIRAYRKVGFKSVGRWEDDSKPNREQKILSWTINIKRK